MLRSADKRLFVGREVSTSFGPGALVRAPRAMVPPVASPAAWYDASDLDTLTLSDGFVSAWADKSGNALDAAASGSMPVVGTPESQRTAVLFRPLESNTSFSSSLGLSDMSFSAFVVGCAYSLSGNGSPFGPNADGGLQCEILSTGVIQWTKSDNVVIGNQSNSGVTAGVPFVVGACLSAGSIDMYFATAAGGVVTETDSHGQTLSASRTLVIGRVPALFSGPENWRGWLGELLFYDTTLGSTDALATVNYLMSKWGIS